VRIVEPTEISPHGTVVRLTWRGPDGAPATATFLPEEDPDTDPRVRAARIAARLRQLLRRPAA
jgi:hypothetical protein